MASASRLTLPRFVALKGDNDRYLCLSPLDGRPYMRFVAAELGDPTVIVEVIVANDGNVSFKQTSSGKYLSLGDTNFIFADADAASNDNPNTLFRPFKVDSQSIALLSSAKDLFCTRYSMVPGITSALHANAGLTNIWARLRVEEPVTTREISNIKYNLDKYSVYDSESVVLVEKSAINSDQTDSIAVDLRLSYEDVKSTIWKTNLSLKLGTKGSFDVESIPIIGDGGKVEIIELDQRQNELDDTRISTTIKKAFRRVVVPPMNKVVVSLIATKGKCDVPFTFKQTDTLYNGETYTTQVEDSTYTVSNYYNLRFQTTEGPLDVKSRASHSVSLCASTA